VFKKEIGSSYQQLVSEYFHALILQAELVNVTNMARNFFNWSGAGSLFKRAIGHIYQYVCESILQLSGIRKGSLYGGYLLPDTVDDICISRVIRLPN
jgi:hypothetical protein